MSMNNYSPGDPAVSIGFPIDFEMGRSWSTVKIYESLNFYVSANRQWVDISMRDMQSILVWFDSDEGQKIESVLQKNVGFYEMSDEDKDFYIEKCDDYLFKFVFRNVHYSTFLEHVKIEKEKSYEQGKRDRSKEFRALLDL